MAVRIAIANPKGGVGKSLTTMMLADGLALKLAARVLVVDMDPQAGVSMALLGRSMQDELCKRQIGLSSILRHWSKGTAIQLAMHRVPAGDLIDLRDREAGLIDLIPSNNELLGSMTEFEQALHKLKRKEQIDSTIAALMKSAIARIEKNFDVVLFDCPAGPVPLGLAALRSVRHIIAPTSLEENSFATLKDFLRFILEDRLGLAESVAVHPLITQYHATNPMQRQMLDQIGSGLYGINAIPRPIPYTVALQAAALHPGRGAFRSTREKYSTALLEVFALADAIATRIPIKVSTRAT